MTGKQHAVMWLGFLLIITRLFTTDQWSSLWSVISDAAGIVPTSKTKPATKPKKPVIVAPHKNVSPGGPAETAV